MMDCAYIYFVVEVKFLVKMNKSEELTMLPTSINSRNHLNLISKRIIPIARNYSIYAKKPVNLLEFNEV